MNAIEEINQLVGQLEGFDQTNMVSDGFHTFGELYQHRVTLYILLCKLLSKDGYKVWKSKLHDDGTMLEGMFILGINTEPGQQISYHVAERFWDNAEFADTLDKAPVYDGHTPQETLTRLTRIVSAL